MPVKERTQAPAPTRAGTKAPDATTPARSPARANTRNQKKTTEAGVAATTVQRARVSVMMQQRVGNARAAQMMDAAPSATRKQSPAAAPVAPKVPVLSTEIALPAPAPKTRVLAETKPAVEKKAKAATQESSKATREKETKPRAEKGMRPTPEKEPVAATEQETTGAPIPEIGTAATAPAGEESAPTSGAAAKESNESKETKPVEKGEAKPTAGGEKKVVGPGEGGKGPEEGAAGGGGAPVTVKMHMPEPPAEMSPATKKRLGGVKKRAGGKAQAHGNLPAGAEQVGDARKAVDEPDVEALAKAQADLIKEVKAAPSPEIVKLCERIRDVIRNKRPPDEDALMEAEPEGEALDAGNQLNTTVDSETRKVQDNYNSMNTAPAATPAKGADLPPQPETADTPPINAKAATPDAVPAENVSLDADVADSQKKMDEAGMEKPTAKLAQSGPVAEARGAQGELEQTAKEDPAKVLAQQEESLAKAETDMAALQAQALAALTTSRKGTVKKATAQQEGMVGSEESMRSKASSEAQAIFVETQTQVNALLAPLATTAMNNWEAAKTILVAKFKADLAPVQKEIDDRHAGVGGFFVGLWDAVTGLPSWAEKAYTTAETNFGDGVIAELTRISTWVNSVIAACEALIKSARERIAKIFNDLPESLRAWAQQEQGKFDQQLDKLQNNVTSTRDNFNKDLTSRAASAVDEVRAEIADLRKKAGGILGRIANAISRFIEDPVKFIIEALLDLLGIPPAAFWAVVRKIKKVISDIADDPEKFANNLFAGLGQGFTQFFDNFGKHMISGFIDWLTGGLASAGVQLPKDLSLKSIITFFLQLMGITWPRIRKLLARHLGEKNVALAEKVYSLLSMLIEKGPEGIFEMIKEKLDPQAIVDQIVDMAVDFMISAIIKAATARIILLFNPVGAILQALEAIYRVLKWIFQNAARIFSLIETVVNGIADIIAGSIGGFANAVEKALAKLIAPVIAFIADYLGFGDLPSKIAETIKGFQDMILPLIEQALIWLIEKGKALLAAVGIGRKEDKKKRGKFDGQIGDHKKWSAGKESHELWIGEAGGEPEAMMASGNAEPVRAKLKLYGEQAKDLKGPDAENRRKRAQTAIADATTILDSTNASAKETKVAETNPEAQPAEVEAKDDATENWEEQLWPQLQIIQIALQLIELPKTVIIGSGDKASTVIANPLSKKGSGGSEPYGKLKGWDHVLKVDHELLNPKTAQWGPAYWVAAHLVSEKLHGPGAPWNTVPARKIDNKAIERGIEDDMKRRVLEDEEVLYLLVHVDYYSGDIVENFPQLMTFESASLRYLDGKWQQADSLPPFSWSFDPPPLDPNFVPSINELGRVALEKRGVPFRLAFAIREEREKNGRFSDEGQFLERMTRVYATRPRPEDFVILYWPLIQSKIAEKAFSI